MKTKQTYFLVFILSFVISSCTKKETPDDIITKPTWKVDKLLINSADSTVLYTPFYCQEFKFSIDQGNGEYFGYNICDSARRNGVGGWSFMNNSTKLIFGYNGDSIYMYGPIGKAFVNPAFVDWDISILNSSQLWLKTNYSGKSYEFRLKAI